VVSGQLLILVLVVEVSLLSGALTLMGVHSMWTWLYYRSSRPVLAMARTILLNAMEDIVPPKDAVELLGSLPLGLKNGLFADVAEGVTGERGQRLAAIAVELNLGASAAAADAGGSGCTEPDS
jgi:hypothetical protein